MVIKYQTAGTVLKYNCKIVDRGKAMENTYICTLKIAGSFTGNSIFIGHASNPL
jgi:hypothetical protein